MGFDDLDHAHMLPERHVEVVVRFADVMRARRAGPGPPPHGARSAEGAVDGVPAGCLWLVPTPPRALASSRLARHVGLGAALTLGVCFLLASRSQDVWDPFLFLAPGAVSLLGSAIAAAVRRSFRLGVQITAWTTLIGTLLVFACWLVEAVRWHGIDGGLLPFGVIGAALGARRPRSV